MDILILAAIAVFIFFKLFEQFGKIDEDKNPDQKKESIRDFIKEQTNTSSNPSQENPTKLIAIPGIGIIDSREIQFDEQSKKIVNELSNNDELKSSFLDVLLKTNLTPSQFISGAKSAFEIILSAFSLGDLATLRPLISEKIFLQFQSDIQNRKSANQSLNIKIISIDENKILGAKVIDSFAQITIGFVSKQINYVLDDKNEVIFGNKTEISTVNDVWTFKKDYTSSDPNWILVSTS